jgi:hypothetical protein
MKQKKKTSRTLDSGEDIASETITLLSYLESRGLSERDGLAIMGFAITSIIVDSKTLQEFIRTLQESHARSQRVKTNLEGSEHD